jgi:hypothetical protein
VPVDVPLNDPSLPWGVRDLSFAQRLWFPVWARLQRWSLTRRCLMCDNLVGDRPPGQSIQYCSDTCRDVHYASGG